MVAATGADGCEAELVVAAVKDGVEGLHEHPAEDRVAAAVRQAEAPDAGRSGGAKVVLRRELQRELFAVRVLDPESQHRVVLVGVVGLVVGDEAVVLGVVEHIALASRVGGDAGLDGFDSGVEDRGRQHEVGGA